MAGFRAKWAVAISGPGGGRLHARARNAQGLKIISTGVKMGRSSNSYRKLLAAPRDAHVPAPAYTRATPQNRNSSFSPLFLKISWPSIDYPGLKWAVANSKQAKSQILSSENGLLRISYFPIFCKIL